MHTVRVLTEYEHGYFNFKKIRNMKKIMLLLVMFVTLFTACDKDQPCPTINAELVPTAVKESLVAHYPGAVVETWFDVDGTGYCAKFPKDGQTLFVHFKTDGTFVSEEGPEDDHEDENEVEDACECE